MSKRFLETKALERNKEVKKSHKAQSQKERDITKKTREKEEEKLKMHGSQGLVKPVGLPKPKAFTRRNLAVAEVQLEADHGSYAVIDSTPAGSRIKDF